MKTPFEFASFPEVKVKGYIWQAEPSEATVPDHATWPSAVVVLQRRGRFLLFGKQSRGIMVLR